MIRRVQFQRLSLTNIARRSFTSNNNQESILNAIKKQKIREENATTSSKLDDTQSENQGNRKSQFEQEQERTQRVLDQADKEAEEKLRSQAKFTSFAVALGIFSSYIYLGVSSEEERQEGDNWFITHNKRVYASLKSSYDV